MVAVEGDGDAGRGDLLEADEQAFARDGLQHREADAAQIDEIVAAEGGEHGGGAVRLEGVAHGRLAAPIGEAALAVRVDGDEVEAGPPVGQRSSQP